MNVVFSKDEGGRIDLVDDDALSMECLADEIPDSNYPISFYNATTSKSRYLTTTHTVVG